MKQWIRSGLAALSLGAALAAQAEDLPPFGQTTIILNNYGWLTPDSFALLRTNPYVSPEPSWDFVEATSVVGRSNGGMAENRATAISSLNAISYGTAVTAPNPFQIPPSNFIGGLADATIFKTYRKDSEDSRLTFTFSHILLQAGWETEFGVKCPPGQDYCQQAFFQSQVRLFDQPDELQWISEQINSLRLLSIGDVRADPGYAFEIEGAFNYVGYLERAGAEIKTLLPQTVYVDLSDIAVDSVFMVAHRVLTWAFDAGGELGPGRYVVANAFDPALGPQVVEWSTGLTLIEGVRAVPEPPTALLALVGLAALGVGRSRRLASARRADLA